MGLTRLSCRIKSVRFAFLSRSSFHHISCHLRLLIFLIWKVLPVFFVQPHMLKQIVGFPLPGSILFLLLAVFTLKRFFLLPLKKTFSFGNLFVSAPPKLVSRPTLRRFPFRIFGFPKGSYFLLFSVSASWPLFEKVFFFPLVKACSTLKKKQS